MGSRHPVEQAAVGPIGRWLLVVGTAALCLASACMSAAGDDGPPAQRSERSAPASRNGQEHPLVPAIRMAKSSLDALEKVADYEAVFSNMEVIQGRRFSHTMRLKLRHKPFSVYLRFYGEHDGREVLYVDGKYGGRLLAHETGLKGLVGTVALDPNSPKALSESRYPITTIGMRNMVETLVRQWERETKLGDADVKFYPDARLSDPNPSLKAMECRVLECTHAKPQRGVPFHRLRLYIAKETNLPVRVEQYGFPSRPGADPPLVGFYTYWNVRTNVGLKDADFDPRNPQYGF